MREKERGGGEREREGGIERGGREGWGRERRKIERERERKREGGEKEDRK